jgi:hypothetical protein
MSLAASSDRVVRQCLLNRANMKIEVLSRLADNADPAFNWTLVANANTPDAVLPRLAAGTDPAVRTDCPTTGPIKPELKE